MGASVDRVHRGEGARPVKAFIGWVRWLWATRNCQHPRTRRCSGDERNHFDRRCLDCGKGLG